MSAAAAGVDYFVLGTVTRDLTAGGYVLGGTGAFSATTARALGRRVGLCARFAGDLDLSPLAGVTVVRLPSPFTTTFENRYTPEGRTQVLHERAAELTLDGVPEEWLHAGVVHFGPLAQDLDPGLAARVPPGALLGVTPQGWLRTWDERGHVRPCDWAHPDPVLERADAVVISLEDVAGEWPRAERWASRTQLLVVTDAERGAVVYRAGTRRAFPAPALAIADPTGAGDVFAAIFFATYRALNDPWAACAHSVRLTSYLLAERQGRFPDAALVRRLLADGPRAAP